jgi:hypothetical protein
VRIKDRKLYTPPDGYNNVILQYIVSRGRLKTIIFLKATIKPNPSYGIKGFPGKRLVKRKKFLLNSIMGTAEQKSNLNILMN